jgi:uncharacterized protein (TIGR02996 family)
VTDEQALRAAVLAHPDDDTPRLVYADWCDDAGDPDRAAFIRAQVEAARAEPWGPAQREAEARAAAVAGRQWEWSTHLPLGVNLPRFARGFVEQVALYPFGFDRLWRTACQVEPVRSLRLLRHGPRDPKDSGWREPEPLDELLGCEELGRVSALEIAPEATVHESDYYDLLRCDRLAGLTSLSAPGGWVTPGWLTQMLVGDRFPALAALDVSDVPNLGPALGRGLADAPHRRFTKLNSTGVRFLSDELLRLLDAKAVSEVEELRLGWPYPGPGPATLIDLGWALHSPRLRLLDLAGQHLGPDGVKEITRTPKAAGLRWLGLARNGLGPAGAEWLLESPHLNLYHLDVSGNGLRPADLAALRARFPEAVVVG